MQNNKCIINNIEKLIKKLARKSLFLKRETSPSTMSYRVEILEQISAECKRVKNNCSECCPSVREKCTEMGLNITPL